MSDSEARLSVVDANSTVQEEHSSNDDNMGNSTGLVFSFPAIIIPTVVVCIIVSILIIYYVWNCVSNYLEAQEEEKAAAAEAAKKAPIAEPEDVSVPIPVDDSVPAADSVEPEVEDTTATDGDVEEGKHGS